MCLLLETHTALNSTSWNVRAQGVAVANASDYFSPSVNQDFNLGYQHGYSGNPGVLDSLPYSRGFLSGAEDRASDQRDMATGELDGLSESEREFLYGLEERASDYR